MQLLQFFFFFYFIYFYLHMVKGLTAACMTNEKRKQTTKKAFEQQKAHEKA